METGIRPPIQMAVDSMRNLCLGYTGEANAQLIQIDVSKWQDKWPGASIDLMLALPGEKASYPAKTELQDGKLLFLPGYGDTQKPGHGAAYVVATKDGTHLAASDTVLTEIMHKGRGGDELPEAPEAQAGWVADVLDAAHRAEEAAKRAENAGGGTITDEQIKEAVDDYLTENPIEAPVQSVNGKTGAVQLSAADVGALPKETPIPSPYTLPVATADTLGGVKVGRGLRMDGNVLGVVPESGMVLIEKITVGEEVAEISRNKEPDGTLYNFSAVTIRAKFPPSDKTGNLSIFFSFKWPAEIRSYMLNPYHATQERNGYSKCYLSNKRWRGGWWTSVRNEGEYAQYYENPVMQEQFGVEDGFISKVSLIHVNGIEAGTIIEIWGARADA